MNKDDPFIYIGDSPPPVPCTNHKWELDFIGMFGKRYESCEICGMKKEDYERQQDTTLQGPSPHNED